MEAVTFLMKLENSCMALKCCFSLLIRVCVFFLCHLSKQWLRGEKFPFMKKCKQCMHDINLAWSWRHLMKFFYPFILFCLDIFQITQFNSIKKTEHPFHRSIFWPGVTLFSVLPPLNEHLALAFNVSAFFTFWNKPPLMSWQPAW